MRFLKRNSFVISLVSVLISTIGSAMPILAHGIEMTTPLYANTPQSMATFELTYVDSSHYIVGHQTVQYAGSSQEATLDINHLCLPKGYYLDEVWDKYTVLYGEVCEIEFQVAPEQAVISRSIDGLEGCNKTAITLNYVEAANPERIVESQTFEQPDRLEGSYLTVFTLHQDYELNVPLGYQLSKNPPEVLQGLRIGRTDFYLEIEPNIPGVDPFYYGKGSGDGSLLESSLSPQTSAQIAPLEEAKDLTVQREYARGEFDLEATTPVYLFYLDEMEQLIDSQTIYFPGQGYILLQEEDLHLPQGYGLCEPWEPFYTEDGEPLTVSMVVTPLKTDIQEIQEQDSSLIHPSIEASSYSLKTPSILEGNQPKRQTARDTAVFQNAFFYLLLAISSLFGFLSLKRLVIQK